MSRSLNPYELPFVVGVMGDFCGDPERPLPSLKDQRFIQVDRDNFNDVMARIAPGLSLKVKNIIAGGGNELSVHLKFRSIDDFDPDKIANQVEPLKRLLKANSALKDLMAELDRSKGPEGGLGQPNGPVDQDVAQSAEQLLTAVAEQVHLGAVSPDQSPKAKLSDAIATVDEVVSRQLSAVMHIYEFQKLEGSWRGLHYLVLNSETSARLKIRVLNASKVDIGRDLAEAIAFDQSEIWKKIYDDEFGISGGEPYGCMLGDYEFTAHSEDVEFLQKMSCIAGASFAPFITAPGPGMFGFDSWSELSKPRDLEKIFEGPEYDTWRSFRESEDSRWVSMVMPRALARRPFGKGTKPIGEIGLEEVHIDDGGAAGAMGHDDYTWMNASYIMATQFTRAYAEDGERTGFLGREGGSIAKNLPTHTLSTDAGDEAPLRSTEITITDRREAELTKLGFLPLCHHKGTEHSAFYGAQTAQKAKEYDDPDATNNAAISARLPYLMVTSLFAHQLKAMAREKFGSTMEASACQRWLNNWIQNYVNANENSSQLMKAKFPLREAKVTIEAIPDTPGAFNVVAHMHPWLESEVLTRTMPIVTEVPQRR